MPELNRAAELAIEDGKRLCALARLDQDAHDLGLELLPDALAALAQLHREGGQAEPSRFAAVFDTLKDEAARLKFRSGFTAAELEDIQLAVFTAMERIHRRRCRAA